jgi:putative salt-induced outer membrane protein YdiY
MAMRQGRAALLCAGLVAWGGASAEEPELGWSDQAELSYVLTAGNSESTTLGFKNELKRTWAQALFSLKLAAIRAESTTFLRTAVGTPDEFVLDESEDSALTAESYLLAGRYDRKVSDLWFWYGGAGWDRNRFSGIENRTVVEGGLGNVWLDRDDLKFKTSYALTYTDQEDVVEVPGQDGTFAGLRVGWDYLNKFGENTTYVNTLVVDDNLEETSDWRADMVNSVAVAMNEHLALKASLKWLYDAQPASTAVPLENPPGTLTGEFALVELEELDTIFTTSLVINW